MLLAGCEPLVRATIGTANTVWETKEEARQAAIADESLKRYKMMADAGNPDGLYYLAVAYAMHHERDNDRGVAEVKRRYEEAVAKGSNSARVALGIMLIEGNSYPWLINGALPKDQRDPDRGLALLKSAAEKSCSFTQPMVSLGACRERENSIPAEIWFVYRSGKGGLPRDPDQAAYWKDRMDTCEPKITEINRSRRCYQ